MSSASTSHLVTPQTLAEHLTDPDWALFDCRFSLADPDLGRRAYATGHIPGARYAHLDEDLSGPIGLDTGRHPLPDPERLAEKLGRWGVDANTRVVAYDDAGGGFAVRLWWLLRWLGHPSAALLDGGLGAWAGQGRSLTAEVPVPEQRLFQARPCEAGWVTTTVLAANLGRDDIRVVDARAPERFRGEIEPIDPVAGHIPGAINLPFAGNLTQDGRFLPPQQLRARFTAALGNRPPQQVVHSCGSGVNACHNLLAMELAGLPGSRLYAGSWSEWIRDPARPIALGPASG